MPLVLTFSENNPLDSTIVDESTYVATPRYETFTTKVTDGQRKTTLWALAPSRSIVAEVEWERSFKSGKITMEGRCMEMDALLLGGGFLSRTIRKVQLRGGRLYKWKQSGAVDLKMGIVRSFVRDRSDTLSPHHRWRMQLVDPEDGSLIARSLHAKLGIFEEKRDLTLEISDRGLASLNLILLTFILVDGASRKRAAPRSPLKRLMPLTLTFLCNDPLNTIIVDQSSGQTNPLYEVTSIKLDGGKRRTTLTALTPTRRVIGDLEWKEPPVSGELTATVKGRRTTAYSPPRGFLSRIIFKLRFMGSPLFKWMISDAGNLVLMDCSNGSTIAQYWRATSMLFDKEQKSTLALEDKGLPILDGILFTFVWMHIERERERCTAFSVTNVNMNRRVTLPR
ncbi:uncharacterized protein FIBRA_09048 [Fibroporia radiculosa]|uniref:DUF6593 domain-containing protein n=1 Tax=Fibroporia radiculosa TaxID=599839 RepID=J4ICP1_9APHY|nr:uncharacterized protein FIBRA_09048 [Fibroporia radiculosa]CCM06751.1 predicted protein [Fibroporia radiculosa]